MTTDELNSLASAYIARYSKPLTWDQDTVLNRRDTSDTDWASDRIYEITDRHPSELLQLVLEVLARSDDPDVLSNLAAGPLEDYLAKCGDQVIDQIESRASADDKFRDLLGGVWQNSMSDQLWQRICACRGEPW